jgi:transposase
LCPDTQRTTEQQVQVEQLLQASAPLATAHPLAQDFGTLIRMRQRDTLDAWLARARGSGSDELANFAQSIQQTYAEVAAALELPWSSGQVEGQINRLKTIKRQMYGRAGFALLRAMVLAPG